MHRAREAKIFEYELHEALEHLARHIAGYIAGHIRHGNIGRAFNLAESLSISR